MIWPLRFSCPFFWFGVEDLDVDSRAAWSTSEWLRANIFLDVLGDGDTCYHDTPRVAIPMTIIPRLVLPD